MAFLSINLFLRRKECCFIECSVAKCDREVYQDGICEHCRELLADKKGYVPLVCWECGKIIDIFHREKGIETDLFSEGCRECKSIEDENKTFYIPNSV